MPAVNHVTLSAGAVAISLAVAAAIAIYESPEVRRYAEEFSRRIALALNSLGDLGNQDDQDTREPMFNRPEDADGFLQSRGNRSNDQEVDADEESRRKQREELMYWNAVKHQKQQEALRERTRQEGNLIAPGPTPAAPRSFDDFLHRDTSGEVGSYVVGTGFDRPGQEGLVHRNVHASRHGMSASALANPFADEHQIDSSELSSSFAPDLAPAETDRERIPRDITSDLYGVSTHTTGVRDAPEPADLGALAEAIQRALAMENTQTSPAEPTRELINIDTPQEERGTLPDDHRPISLGDRPRMANEEEDYGENAHLSIQAWARHAQTFYPSIPASPSVASSSSSSSSDPEIVSTGQMTPTDTGSLAGSGYHVSGNVSEGDNDVLSDDDGILTPSAWSEIGSTVSEADAENIGSNNRSS